MLTACSAPGTPINEQAAAWTPIPAPTSFVPSAPTLPAVGGSNSPLGRPTAEPAATPEPRAIYTVERGEVTDELLLSGRVAPVQALLSFAQDGTLGQLLVAQGQEVEAGQLIAELDLGELPSQLRQAQATYEQDLVALNQASEAGQLLVELAQVDLDEANARLAEAQQPATSTEIAEARAALQQAESNLSTVRNEYSSIKTNARQDLSLASQLLEEAQTRYSAAYHKTKERIDSTDEAERRAERDAREQALADARRGLIEAEDRVARAQIAYDTAYGNEIAAVEQAEAELAVAQAELEALLTGPKPGAIGDAQRDVQRATIALREARQLARPDPELVKQVAASKAEIDAIENLLAGKRLYAPFAGTLVAVEASVGSAIRAGLPLGILMDATRQEIVATPQDSRSTATQNRLPVSAGQVSVGQPAEITFSRYASQVISGTITRVPGNLAGDLVGTAASTAYHLSFNTTRFELVAGDLADVRLVLGRKYDTLWLPLEAVTFGDTPFVTRRNGDTEERVDIQVGLISADRVEILSGLLENDVVVVR